ncbi:hypothetical protein N7490_004145 [Penicillium lividum]|nr:hypothetical protein N7490_004145 [Penicillium lividum]
MCAKHPLLAHLVTAFSVRDMAMENEIELLTVAMEHYQKALSLFIEHLSAPHVTGWITFPALWLFIVYEQTYGDDPNVLQTHLRGVRDILITHGAEILPGSLHYEEKAGQDAPPKYWVQPQMIDRMALWTIHHDAKASTFGLGANIVSLLDEQYPGAIARICQTSANALHDAWGSEYPVQEEIWDVQTEVLFVFAHESAMLRYELSNIERESDHIDPYNLLLFSRKLKELQERASDIITTALSRRVQRSHLLSNKCITAADILALVIRHDRLLYENRLSSIVSQVLQICHSIHEYEGDGYLWRAAWPMFVAAFETKDPIHQGWILERFAALSAGGQNMRRAHDLLKAMFMDMRTSTGSADYLAWIRDERYPRFVI